LVLLIGTIPLFVFFPFKIWEEEADEHNRFLINEIQQKYQTSSGKGMSDSIFVESVNRFVPFCTIQLDSQIFRDSIYDAQMPSPDNSNEMEQFRYLTHSVPSTSGYLTITAATNVEDMSEGLQPLLIYLILFTIILFSGFFLINLVSATNLKNSFHSLLKRLKHYEPGLYPDAPVHFHQIKEFYELDSTFNELFNRINAIHNKQKNFIADTAHELQTPISVIRLKLDKLSQKYSDNQHMREDLSELQQPLSRLNHMVRNLLLMAKIENEQYTSKERINISDTITEISNLLKEYAAGREIQIHIENHPNVLISCNPTLFGTLFQNLLINAIHYSKSGSRVNVNLNNSYIMVSNPGVQKLEAPLNPKRFSKSESQGSGLGLAIASQICAESGWTLTYTFELNMHRFTVFFNTTEFLQNT
jgi:signal transduction histidine kinase